MNLVNHWNGTMISVAYIFSCRLLQRYCRPSSVNQIGRPENIFVRPRRKSNPWNDKLRASTSCNRKCRKIISRYPHSNRFVDTSFNSHSSSWHYLLKNLVSHTLRSEIIFAAYIHAIMIYLLNTAEWQTKYIFTASKTHVLLCFAWLLLDFIRIFLA